MLRIYDNHSLLGYNTFHMNVEARHFCEVNTVEEFKELMTFAPYKNSRKLILGGGSNILFTGNFDGLVIRNNLRGLELVSEDDQFYYIKAGAGENWHKFVVWTIHHGYAGLENLSLIPGNVGASPMQNIGAYGIEIKDVFEELEALDMETGELISFTAPECEFGYRESVFKRKYKEKFLITSVTFRLSKQHLFNTSYGAIEQELDRMGVKELSAASISEAVIRIRSSKLPNPVELGNAGSFFKNPEINPELFDKIKLQFPKLVSYPLENGNYKLAAGWLIEQAGWKGKRLGDAGVHQLQALVLVNHGAAKGQDIFDLSQKIMDSVRAIYGVQLEREVNIY